MEPKKLVEHYRDHEISCVATPGPDGWSYTVAVVTHDGDDSSVRKIASDTNYRTDLAALQAGIAAGRRAVDGEMPAH